MMLDYCYEKSACHKCGRKILVEMGLVGAPHHSWIMVTCADCVQTPINDTFREKQPEAATEIEKWLQAGITGAAGSKGVEKD